MIESLELYQIGVGVAYGSRGTLVSTGSHICAMATPNVRALLIVSWCVTAVWCLPDVSLCNGQEASCHLRGTSIVGATAKLKV